MFPEEPVGPLWAKGLLWSLGGVAAHLRKEKSCTRAAFFPSRSIYRSPPLGLRRPTVASSLRLLAFQTWSRRLWKTTLIDLPTGCLLPVLTTMKWAPFSKAGVTLASLLSPGLTLLE